jgi:hypothetical protein
VQQLPGSGALGFKNPSERTVGSCVAAVARLAVAEKRVASRWIFQHKTPSKHSEKIRTFDHSSTSSEGNSLTFAAGDALRR